MGGGGGRENGNLIPFLGVVFRWSVLLSGVEEWRGLADIRARIPGGLLSVSSGKGESESLAKVKANQEKLRVEIKLFS